MPFTKDLLIRRTGADGQGFNDFGFFSKDNA